MRAPLACLLLLQLFLVFSEGEPQFFYGGNPYHQYFQQPYFRNQAFQEGDSFAARVDPEPRFFFSALTLTLTTTTVTRTVTSSTVCTTTTAALSNCLASGGRRRRSSSSPHLYYNDSPLTDNEESMFLPLSQKELEKLIPANEEEPVRPNRDLPHYPLALQSGLNPLSRNAMPRFLLAVDTSTIYATSTAIVTVSLTAICSSTSGFSACVASG